MEILFFIFSLISMGLAAFFAYQRRYNAKKCIAAITLGVFFATFFMVLPTQWVKEGKEVFCEPLYALLSSLLYSLKALGGRQDIAQLETIAMPAVLKAVYIVLGYVCFALAPILASTLLLSFVGDTGEKIRFMLQRAPKCYVFSEVNENALALAKGITSKPDKKTIVFCNGKDADKGLVTKAKELGAIVLYKSCKDLAVTRFDAYEFFLISTEEDNNIYLAETMIAKHSDNKNAKILMNAFVESGTNVNFLESVIKGRNTNIELRCVDEIALFCNHLVYNYPLYDTKGNGRNISVAIVGCGRTGMRMLKTVYWAGQIYNHKLKIRVYDKDAEACQEDFYRQCPGLKNEEIIKFVEADVRTAGFETQLLAPENSSDATYIVVAMGNDQLNLSVSDELYRIYRRHFNFRDSRMPEIFTRVREQGKSDKLSGNAEFLQTRHIHLFGTTAAIFSDKMLFDTELENLALAVHLAYDNKLHMSKDSEEYIKSCKNFKTGEYNRRSSMAVALHIPAKLYMCEALFETQGKMLTAENMQKFARCLADDPSLRRQLAINEHIRWMAFFLSEGYLPATIKQMHQYAKVVDSHKDKLSMMHPCIVDWEDLEEVQNAYNSTYGKNEEFKKHDKEIVEKIPEIWAFAQQMNGENEDV